MRSEILTVVKMSILVFWVVTTVSKKYTDSFFRAEDEGCMFNQKVDIHKSTWYHNPEDHGKQLIICLLHLVFLHLLSEINCNQ
jgi:hypothetical protein